jgi:hypothetical protein
VVADRLLVELGTDGRVSVGQWLEGELPNTGVPSDLAWPLGADALEDLRWYLEDYLRVPFGVYEERGPQVQARLAEWGEAVFSAVFGDGPARDAYVRMRARRAGVEVVFRSPSPALLGLPWELMRDPGRPSLCVPKMSSTALTSRVALSGVRPCDHRSCVCGSCSS